MRNTGQPPVTGTQCLEGKGSGLARIRATAKRESNLQFNNLYDHITYERLHQQRYQPQPSLRTWKTRENGAKRAIGITALEDEIVQQALA
jgi:RNA-directed DNA polymerase